MSERFEVEGLDAIIRDFEKLSAPGKNPGIRKLDNLFHAAGAAVNAKVHVETGRLKESGRVSTHLVGDVWMGEISYRRYPGIFELARGDSPTRYHPEGGHFFFNAVEPFIPHISDAVDEFFSEIFSKVPV